MSDDDSTFTGSDRAKAACRPAGDAVAGATEKELDEIADWLGNVGLESLNHRFGPGMGGGLQLKEINLSHFDARRIAAMAIERWQELRREGVR